jgi:GGDEF domain-containing protein
LKNQKLGGVTLSFGIAVSPDHGETGEAVLWAADIALYRAKGGNCMIFARSEKSVLSRKFMPVI